MITVLILNLFNYLGLPLVILFTMDSNDFLSATGILGGGAPIHGASMGFFLIGIIPSFAG